MMGSHMGGPGTMSCLLNARPAWGIDFWRMEERCEFCLCFQVTCVLLCALRDGTAQVCALTFVTLAGLC